MTANQLPVLLHLGMQFTAFKNIDKWDLYSCALSLAILAYNCW